MKLKPQILCFTSILFLIGLYFLIIKIINSKSVIKIEYFLVTLLVICTIVSVLFWSNPIKNSKMHKIDRLVARITIISFILYNILFYTSYNISYLFIILAATIAFYTSHYYSSRDWISNEHILTHGLAHILCAIALAFT